MYTVESFLTDTPNKGHCIKYLSTMDKTKSLNFNPPINIMQLESLIKGQSLYSGQTTCIYIGPKVSFIRRLHCIYKYSVDIYLLCMIKIRVRWCTCSLWRML